MDIRLFARVLWRFRLLTAAGLILAFMLACLSLVSVSYAHGGIKTHFRSNEEWLSRSTVLVTERRFPLGRAVLDGGQPTDPSLDTTTNSQAFAPSSRFTELASIYAALATSDAVRQYISRDGPLAGKITASALTTANSDPLPLFEIDATSTSAGAAAKLAQRTTQGIQSYIEIEQRESGIPVDQRVVLSVVKEPIAANATLTRGHSKTLPIVVFLVVMFGVIALAFILENLRPQIRVVPAEQSVVEAAPTRLHA